MARSVARRTLTGARLEKEILRAMKKNGSTEPKFKTDDHSFFATILPIPPRLS
ncbi:MAG: hypothetical protein KIT72_00325 [Polyangiaceae bacterium]|nr:hypothetical protein [Polyangiaceae bacterium]MCW5788841.1 hypothetical protein [Polyangiaceae bacterium]